MQKLFEELESHFREEQEKTKLEVCTQNVKNILFRIYSYLDINRLYLTVYNLDILVSNCYADLKYFLQKL